MMRMPPQHPNTAYYGGMPPREHYGCLPGGSGVGYNYGGTALPSATTMPTTGLYTFPMAVPQIQTTPTPLATSVLYRQPQWPAFRGPPCAESRGVKRSAEVLGPARESHAPQRKLMRVKHLCAEEWAASLQVNVGTGARASAELSHMPSFFAPSWAPGLVPRASRSHADMLID